MTYVGARASFDVARAASELQHAFAATAAARERRGGSALAERKLIRESGLLLLRVPAEYGGLDAGWRETMDAVRSIARADSSLAHIFAWHQLEVVTPRLIGTPTQAARYEEGTARNGWFWGSALNPLDARVTLTRQDAEIRINGTKSFCTGARDSDMLLVGAVEAGVPGVHAIAIPTNREGITVNDDWDNMGQRQSDSGSVTFSDVLVSEDEMLGRVRVAPTLRLALRTCLSQLMLANMFVGIAEGALADARSYTLNQTRPWPGTDVARAADEPMIVHHYGEMWIRLRAAACLADDAAARLEDCWSELDSLRSETVKACLITVDAVKVLATQVGLDVTSRTFEVMGARATSGAANHDRHWRNLRTLTLHDPVEMRIREAGNWYLNDRLPVPDVTT